MDKELGIRFYYAAYPEISKWSQPNYEALQDLLNDKMTRKYEKKHTLVMIPTIATSTNVNSDFNPLDLDTYVNGFGYDLHKDYNYKMFANSSSSIAAQNHGSLVPPEDDNGDLKFLLKPLVSKGKNSQMNYSLVHEMIANYRNNQLRAIENSGDPLLANDAQSIWFSLETLKNFILTIENAVAEKLGNSNKNLGIRFYYAAYPEISKWDQPNYKDLKDLLNDPITRMYEKKHTLVMIPTIETATNTNTDFNQLDVKTYVNGFNDDLDLQKNNSYETLAKSSSTSIIAQNHGSLIPPADNTGERF